MYIPSVVAPGITLLDSVEAMLLLIIPPAGIVDEVVVNICVDKVVVNICVDEVVVNTYLYKISATYVIIIMISKPDQCIPESSDGRLYSYIDT